jgi:hypothetical protein
MAPEPWTFRQSAGLIVGTALGLLMILFSVLVIDNIGPAIPHGGVVTPSPTPYPSGWTYTP